MAKPNPSRIYDKRGNSVDRRKRKEFLVNKFGNGITAPCWECKSPLRVNEMVADRIIPGIRGGRYTRNNIRPQCHPCSRKQGYEIGVGIKHKEMALSIRKGN